MSIGEHMTLGAFRRQGETPEQQTARVAGIRLWILLFNNDLEWEEACGLEVYDSKERKFVLFADWLATRKGVRGG